MNIRIKAALLTAGILASCIASVSALAFIVSSLSTQTIIYIIGAGFFVFMIYVFYGIALNRLEYEQRLKEIIEKK
jgi:hypothetical protein